MTLSWQRLLLDYCMLQYRFKFCTMGCVCE